VKTVFNNIKGDRLIWAIAALLAIFSFLPVYSAASNLAYTGGNGNTFSYFVKHFMHLFLGFSIMYGVHKIPYRYFRGLSMIMIPVVLVLLVVTVLQGTTIDGANAKKVSFKETLLPLWIPVFIILALILPANFSTTAIIFCMVMMLAFLGGYPIRYLLVIIGTGIAALVMFVLVAKAFPDAMPNRIDTWMSRINNFADGGDSETNYQIEKAKIAIASGKVTGVGPGKSTQKNFLPQSSSDFIFAIIIEEYGLAGGLFLMLLYLWLLFRIVIVAQKSDSFFGKLLALGVGLPIVFQALINMAVAVELFPVKIMKITR